MSSRLTSAAALAVTACLALVAAQPREVEAAAPPGTSCSAFPADNVWNTDISTLPVNSHSAAWLASTGATGGTLLHPDFGGPPYGMPFNVVDSTHPTASVNFLYWQESDPTVPTQQPQGPYPYGSDLAVEGPTDSHLLTINKDTCALYEVAGTDYNGARTGWSGAIFNLGSNALRPDTWTSADAAGLPIFPGLVRLDEVQAGSINHAIRFTVQQSDRSHLWPARHDAGAANNPNLPPMGARFRLRSSFDISSFNAQTQVVLTAMKHYGLIAADNGSNWFFQGTMDSGWNSEPYATMVAQLKTIPASAFEAVDESSLMVDQSSGQALQPSRCTGMAAQATPGAPQPAGTAIQVTATASGCAKPRYEVWLHSPNGTWSLVQPYSFSATFNWSAAAQVPGTYRFSVWARDSTSPGSGGTAPNTYDSFSAFDYTLTATTCTGMSASAAPATSAAIGTQVNVTAAASGCANPRYAFYLLPPGGTWSLAQPYSTNPTFTWNTAGKAAGSYRFSVWARDASSSSSYDAFSAFQYSIAVAPCSGMSVTVTPTSTATRGTTVTIAGSATGCPSPQYELWYLPPGGTWALARGYASGGTFLWTTAGSPAGSYRFSVWARDAASGGSSGSPPYTYDSFSAFQYALT